MKSTYNRAEHQRQRAEIERHFGGLDKATDLRNIGVDSPFALRAFVDHIRNVDVVMAFHGSTPEWWLVKGEVMLRQIATGDSARRASMAAVIVPNLEMVEFLSTAIEFMEKGEWPVQRSDWVCPSRSARNYAPAVFAKHPDSEGIPKPIFAAAMQRLLKAGQIRVEKYGRPSEPRTKLAPP
jgi:hypothetical protein